MHGDNEESVNRKQAAFYDSPIEKRGNVITQGWIFMRRRMSKVRRVLGISNEVYELHWQWLGDLSDKKVLDLGSGSGSPLSVDIARKSASYLAIDLSERQISILSDKLNEAQIPHARAEVHDFLSSDFIESFDVIYAHSVMHHFADFDTFCCSLASHLNPDGYIVSNDPLQTDWTVRLLRNLYRPFQADKDWEWPFSVSSFTTIQKFFRIAEVQGILGYSKWAAVIGLISPTLSTRFGTRFHQRDLRDANRLGRGLWRCMHVIMKLEVKPDR